MNLYDQLLQLQVIPNAYSEWKEYREDLTDYIISHLEWNQSVAIVGIGRGNDIDLEALLPYVKKLILIDKDEQALLAASKQYHLTGKSKVELISQDLLGLNAEDYRRYAERLVGELRKKGMNTSMEVLLEVAIQEFNQLVSKMKLISLGYKVYDVTIAIGLHSQLLSMIEWIWQVVLQTIGKQDTTLRTAIIELTPQVICAFHEQLIEATKSKLIIGCELGRKNRTGTVQGAIQGLEDLTEQRKLGKLGRVEETILEWPFNRASDIVYNMLIQVDEVL
ncbi:MAG: hypothetical protein E7231_00955 [Cellulosilyticum sp.]|nr:hypothetical protein [Cellulosilyticum sp.]